MRHHFATILLCLCGFLGCADKTPSPRPIGVSDYDVYALVMREVFVSIDSSAKSASVTFEIDSTHIDHDFSHDNNAGLAVVTQSHPSLALTSIIEDYKRQDTKRHALDLNLLQTRIAMASPEIANKIVLRPRTQWTPQTTIQYQASTWNTYAIGLTRVGFDTSFHQAATRVMCRHHNKFWLMDFYFVQKDSIWSLLQKRGVRFGFMDQM
jgi:hypothetical protein